MWRFLAVISATIGLGSVIAYAQIINPSTGGGGTPGGSSTQLQFNTNSTFGGISGVTSDSANVGFATSSQLFLYGTTVGDCLKVGANNQIADFGAGCGGSGSPGGLNTQVQFNTAGTFGGVSGATSNGSNISFTTNSLVINGQAISNVSGNTGTLGTVTGSLSTNCLRGDGSGNIGTTGVPCATQTATPSIAAGSNITTSGTAANTTINVVATPSFTTVIASGNITAGTAQFTGLLTGTNAVFQTVTVNNLTPTGPNCLQETGGVLQATNTGCATQVSTPSIAAGSNITTSGTAANTTINVVATPSFTTIISSGNLTAGTAQITGLLTGTNAVFQTLTVSNLTPTGPNCLQETGGVLQATNAACASPTSTSIAAGTNIQTYGSASNITVAVSPAGGTTQLQYNNAGALGGVSGATANGTAVTFATSDLIIVNRAITGVSGNTGTLATVTGSLVSGNCLQSDASHNLVDSGSPTCGGAGGISGSGVAGQVALWNASTVLTGDVGITFTSPGQLRLNLGTYTATSNAALNIIANWSATNTEYDAPLFMNVTTSAIPALGAKFTDIQVNTKSVLTLGNTNGGPLLALSYVTAPTAVTIYNTVDDPQNPTNWEGASFNWTDTANTFTIKGARGGTGANRDISFAGGGNLNINMNSLHGINNSTWAGDATYWFVNRLSFQAGNGSFSSDTIQYRDAAAGVFGLANSTNPTTLRVYNTTDQVGSNVAPTNYERGIFDWASSVNTLTIGTQQNGTGVGRNVSIIASNTRIALFAPTGMSLVGTSNLTATTAQFTGLLTGTNAVFQTLTVSNLTPTGPNCLQETGGVLQATNTGCATQVSIAAGANITTSGTSSNISVAVVPTTPEFGVQYNHAGVLTADSGFTYASGLGIATLSMGNVSTTNSKAISLVGNWTVSTTTFSAPLFVNIQTNQFAAATTNGFGATSKLADVQASGISFFSVFANTGVNIVGNVTGTQGAFPGFLTATGTNFFTSSVSQLTATSAFVTSVIGNAGTNSEGSISFLTNNVAQFGDGGINANGWYNWSGEGRTTADSQGFISTGFVNLITISNLKAGRTYKFNAEAPIKAATAATGGIQFRIGGGAVATNVVYDGWLVDHGQGGSAGIKGSTQATALSTTVAASTITGTTGHLTLIGTISVSGAGTLILQASGFTTVTAASAVTVGRGATFIVEDMP